MTSRQPRSSPRALVDAGDDQALRAEINTYLGLLWHGRGDLQRALAHAQAARAAAKIVGEARLLTRALSLVVLLEVLVSPSVSERPAGAYSPRLALGIQLLLAGRFADARAVLEADHADALASGDEPGRARVLAQLADLELRAGRWDQARRYAREGVDVTEQMGLGYLEAALLAVHARVCAHVGEADEARAAATRGGTLARDAKAELYRVHNEAALGLVELSQQRMQHADHHLRPLLAEADRMGIVEPVAMPFVPDAVEAMIESGAADEARLHVEQLEIRARDRPSSWARGAAYRSRGLWLAAEGQLSEAEDAFRTALREHETSGEPFEQARTLLAFGTTLRRAKQKRAAREAIEASLEVFERLGAEPWAGTARGELARIPGRRPSANRLTPTEQRVAELVADGRSNKEVAAALHVTVKTVEGTLSRVYAKHGVRSRTELARHIAAEKGLPARS
jgi:DNA-binding CsgD family transcriptional regulator